MMAEEHKKLRPKKKLIRTAYAFLILLSGSIAWMGLVVDKTDPLLRFALSILFWAGLSGFTLILVLSGKTVKKKKQGNNEKNHLFLTRERMLSAVMMIVFMIAVTISEYLLHQTGASFLFLALFTFSLGIFLMQGEMLHIYLEGEKKCYTREEN